MFYSYIWGDKYLPKNINELYGNKQDIQKISKILKDLYNNIPNTNNGLILNNDGNINIKHFIKIILKECNFTIQEIDNEYLIDSKFENILNNICVKNITDIFNNKKTAIIITDNFQKKKTAEIILEYMNNNKFTPIICLFQNNYVNNINFNKKFYTINIVRPSDNEIYNLIKLISKNENIVISDIIIRLLVDKCNNDINRTFLILENIKTYYSDKKINIKEIQESIDVFCNKDIDINSYGFIKNLYNESIDVSECIDYWECNQNINLLLHENFFNNLYSDKNVNHNIKYDVLYKYYTELTNSSIIDKFVFNNRKLSNYIGFLSLKYPNYLIHKNNINVTKINLSNSGILSKVNYHFFNLKFINEITKKLDISTNQFQFFTLLMYDYFIFNNIKYEKQIKKITDKLSDMQFSFSNFDKTIKLSFLYERYAKSYTNQKKKKYASIFNIKN